MEVKDNTVSFVTNFSKSYASKKSNLNRISRFSNAYDYYEITPSGNVQSEQPDFVKKNNKPAGWQCCKTISSHF